MEPDLEYREYDALRNEIAQRSKFQHNVYLANLAVAGALITLAFDSHWHQAFLVVPILSFGLFINYLSEALSIGRIGRYLEDHFDSPWQKHPERRFSWLKSSMRLLTFSLSNLVNFVGIPLIALLLYHSKEPYPPCDLRIIMIIDVVLLVASVILFFVVFWSTYWQTSKEAVSND